MYERILLPTDGEDGAEAATRHAIDLASVHGAALDALYVVDETVFTAHPGDEYVHELEGAEAALERVGEGALDAVAEAADSAGVGARTELRYGIPHEEVVDYADEVDADLIVVGTRSRSGARGRLLGSVTDRVARIAEQPVTIVKIGSGSAAGDAHSAE